MKIDNLTNMVRGWFIGNFDPSVFKTDQFEVAIRRYDEGYKEKRHLHKVATEYTVVVSGIVKMNGHIYVDDAIIEMPPGESTDFEAVTSAITVIVKVPCVRGDKYEVDSPQG